MVEQLRAAMSLRQRSHSAHDVRRQPTAHKRGSEPVRLPSLSKKAGKGDAAAQQPRLQKASSEPQLKRHKDDAASVTQQDARLTFSEDTEKLSEDARRKVLELLTSPDVRKVAEKLFKAEQPNGKGKLSFEQLREISRKATKKLGLPPVSNAMAEKLFKRYDVDGDGALTLDDFYDLFVSGLRRVAWDNERYFEKNVFAATRQSEKVWDVYEQVKKLGSGSFGSAHLCKNKLTGDERVIKSVEKTNAKLPVEDIEREIMVMQQIDHPHIVRLYEWYEGKHSIYLVLDPLKGGTLREVVLMHHKEKGKGMTEIWIRKVIRQTVEAMAYIHSLRLIHKDLKDDNLMLLKQDEDYDDPYVVIIDLGVAEMFSPQDPHGKLVGGTPATMAPEVWKGNFGPKCDVFSVGCILFELLCGSMPFVAMSFDPKDWTSLHKKGPNWSLIKTSDLGKDLCRHMLRYRDSDRPSMKQCLKHEWFHATTDTMQSAVAPAQFASLQKFCDMNVLTRSLLLDIAGRLPMEKAEKVVKVFNAFDYNRDGGISKKELHQGFKSMGVNDRELVDNSFAAMDVDNNGTLSFREFSAGVLLIFKDLLETRFRSIFRRNDKDFDGYLTRKEVENLLSTAASISKKEAIKRREEVLGTLFPKGTLKVGYDDIKRHLLPMSA